MLLAKGKKTESTDTGKRGDARARFARPFE
jgi:hypothetical protein